MGRSGSNLFFVREGNTFPLSSSGQGVPVGELISGLLDSKKLILKEGKHLVVGYPLCEYRIIKH